MISKIFLVMRRQERLENLNDLFGRCWVSLDANDTMTLRERQNHPVSEMLVKGNQSPLFRHRSMQDVLVVGTTHPHFRCPRYLVALSAKPVGHFDAKHLVQEQSHRA